MFENLENRPALLIADYTYAGEETFRNKKFSQRLIFA